MFPLRDQYLSCLGIESDEDLSIFEQQIEKYTMPKICILHFFAEDWVLKKRQTSDEIVFDHILSGPITRNKHMGHSMRRFLPPLPMAKATDTKTGHGSFFLGEFNQDFSIANFQMSCGGSLYKLFVADNRQPIGLEAPDPSASSTASLTLSIPDSSKRVRQQRNTLTDSASPPPRQKGTLADFSPDAESCWTSTSSISTPLSSDFTCSFMSPNHSLQSDFLPC